MVEQRDFVRLVDRKERRFQKLPIELWLERSWFGWKVQWQMPDLDGEPVSHPCFTLKGALSKQAKLIIQETGMKREGNPPQERECPECKGSGILRLHDSDGAIANCPTCNGTGQLPPERESYDVPGRTSSRAPIRTEGDDLVKPPFGDDLEAAQLPPEPTTTED